MSSPVMRFTVIAFGISVCATALQAQTVVQPDIGYVYPPGGCAGQTIDVKLGVYDFTPDLQFFVLDHAEHVRLEITGLPGPLLLHGAPFLSGTKAYRPLPLPREIPARLHLSADLPAGRIRWQIANANGSSKIGSFFVSRGREVLEQHRRGEPQPLDGLPMTVSATPTLQPSIGATARRRSPSSLKRAVRARSLAIISTPTAASTPLA